MVSVQPCNFQTTLQVAIQFLATEEATDTELLFHSEQAHLPKSLFSDSLINNMLIVHSTLVQISLMHPEQIQKEKVAPSVLKWPITIILTACLQCFMDKAI